MKTTKNVWTAILLWMALCSFTLSAQVTGTETTIDLSNAANLTNGSYIIRSTGTYHFTGTYNGTPTAEIGQSEGKAVISVETSDDVTIILENVTISLSGDKECPLSARNATGKVTVQLKGTNKLETKNISSDQCPALWAPEPPNGNGELIIMNLEGNEGSLTATARDAWDAPGIGSKGTQGSHITIKSGKIIANGGHQGAGIGGGEEGAGGTIIITNGTVKATGGGGAAGIGGGYKGAGGTITISGGNVTAKSVYGGAGIGGGNKGAGGTITITNGTVTAKGGNEGAGIGSGGWYGAGGTINISGGTVEAKGGDGGAGIGGGYLGDGGTITISGGTVQEAKGGESGAGIGGGNGGDGGTITISGGEVTATGGDSSTDYGGAGEGGAGIGYGYNGSGGTITITEGEVKATSGANNGDVSDINGDTMVVGPNANVKTKDGGTPKYNNYTNGFVFKENFAAAEMQGTATLLADMTIGVGKTLTISENASLTIEKGVTLTNNGTITNSGTIYKRGTIDGSVSNENAGKIIEQTKLTESMITVAPATYTGRALEPTVTVKSSSVTYTINDDYTLEYANNTNAAELTAENPPTVTVTPTDGGKLYGDAVSMMFTIQPKPLSFTFKGLDNLTYDGAGHEATVSTTDLVAGDNVEPMLVYQKKGENKVFADIEGLPTDAGTYKVIVKSVDNPNYTVNEAYNYTEFTIAQATTSIDAFAEIDNKIYNGIAINITAPAVTGVGLTDVKAKLTYKTKDAEDATYTETAPKDAGSYTVKATYAGDDNHEEANETADFIIKPKTLIAEMVTLTPESFTYNGREQRPEVTVMDGDLMTANDYAISYSDGSTIVGTYTVTVTGQGNYQGRQAKNYSIKKATPASPTNLTATYGQTLDDVELPEGWTWRDATTTPVGDVGTRTFHAKYTPSDTHNYNEVADAEVSIEVAPANANLSFAQPTLTLTEGDAVPANALTKPEDCTVTYTSSDPEVATVDADGVVTVVGVGTAIITATAGGNYSGTATYTLTVNRYTPPYTPPTDPVYYTVTIPTEVKGAIIHGGGTHEVEEGSNYSFRIELDPNGSGEYPTVTKDYAWNTLTPDGAGNYSFMVTDDTEISISEVPTSSYSNYQLSLPTDSVAESDNQYWSGNYIEVMGVSLLRATEETMTLYDVPFGTTVTLRPIETAERKFLQWEDGSTDRERTLTLRADKEIRALWQYISPVGIETIAANSVIRGERGQLYIEVPIPCDVVIYNYNGVPVRVAHLTEGANRIHSLNAGLYLVRIGGAPAVPVRVR